MRRFIKTALIVIAVLIFLFSSNPTITSIRNSVFNTGKNIYNAGVDKIKSSKDSTIVKAAQALEPKK